MKPYTLTHRDRKPYSGGAQHYQGKALSIPYGVSMQFGRSAGCKLTPTRRALLAEGLCSKPQRPRSASAAPNRLRRCGAAGLPRLVHKRMGMEWPAAAGVVDDRGYCGRGPAQVSASGVDTVAFRSFGEVVVL